MTKKLFSKSVFAAWVLFLLVALTPKWVFAKDYFTELEALKIGGALPQTLRAQAEVVEDDNPNTTYLRFESASFSYPHYVEVDDASSKIIYVELKVPEAYLEEYRNQLNSLGEPETKEVKTESFILLGFPSKGIGFIVSETGKNFMLFTRYPVKTVEELRSNEAKNFKPVPQVSKTNAPEENDEKIEAGFPILAIAVLAGTIIISITIIIFLFKKRGDATPPEGSGDSPTDTYNRFKP